MQAVPDFKGVKAFRTRNLGTVKVGVLKGQRDGLSLLEAHLLVDRLNSEKSPLRLIRPQVADEVLTGSPDNWKFFAKLDCLIFPTSLVVAYNQPHKQLGYMIRFSSIPFSITFHTSGHHWQSDAAIFAEATAKNFKADGNSVVISAEPEHLKTADLPGRSGCYSLYSHRMFPSGSNAHPNSPDARHLQRSPAPMVTALYRETGHKGEAIKHILLDRDPFNNYGVAVEIANGDLAPGN
jgi:hypothetical protein